MWLSKQSCGLLKAPICLGVIHKFNYGHSIHCVGQGTKRGRRKFWERRISMIYLCSKYVKNCNIFGQILNIWLKLILKKKIPIFFQCLALPKDPQSFGSQNLRCPFSVSQYYRRQRLWPSQKIWTFQLYDEQLEITYLQKNNV